MIESVSDMVKAENIGKKYKGKYVLKNISFELAEHQIIGLVGPNGAGKSTLMRIISGINKPSEGEIIIKEKNKKLNVSVVFDYNGLYSQLTARENLLFFLRLDKKRKNEETIIDETLEKMGLLEVKNMQVKTFSKGMMRKLAIARAILTNPDVLLLDEPFDGLDVESHAYIMLFLKKWVQENNKGIILSSHCMSDIESVCTDILVMKQGIIQILTSITKLKQQALKNIRIIFRETFQYEEIIQIIEKYKAEVILLNKNELILDRNIDKTSEILSELVEKKYIISEVIQDRYTLEEIYLKIIGGRKNV